MTTRKTIALIRLTFVGKVMSLLFNMLSRLVVAFLPLNEESELFGGRETVTLFFGGSKITADGGCSHEI